MTDDWNDEEQGLFERRWTSISRTRYDRNKLSRLNDSISDWKAWARPIFKDMTFDAITVKHQKYTEIWRGSEAYRVLFKSIEQTALKQNHLEVSLCMCLGLGSFTGVHHKDIGEKSRNCSLSQLVAFEGWVEQLRTRFDIQHVYFQDPMFTVLDRNFLVSRGHEILYTPESDSIMSETTFLFTPGAEQAIEESSLDSAFPAMMMSSALTQHMDYHFLPENGSLSHERWWQEKLPAPASTGRTKLFSNFMSQRAALHLPDPDKSNYWRTWLYFKPDSVADIEPFEWEEKTEDCLTEKQAHEIWLSRGLTTAEELEKMEEASWHRKPDFEWSDEMKKKLKEIAEANSAATNMDEES